MSGQKPWLPKATPKSTTSAAVRYFDELLAADLLQHGRRVVAQLRMRKPERYLRLALERSTKDADITSEEALASIMGTLSEKHVDALAEVLGRDTNPDQDTA